MRQRNFGRVNLAFEDKKIKTVITLEIENVLHIKAAPVGKSSFPLKVDDI